MGRPCHGDLSAAQVQVAVAAIDFEGVDQHADDGAAEDDDEQAQTGADPAEPMRSRHDGQVERHMRAQAFGQGSETVDAVVLGLFGED